MRVLQTAHCRLHSALLCTDAGLPLTASSPAQGCQMLCMNARLRLTATSLALRCQMLCIDARLAWTALLNCKFTSS